MIIVIDYDNDAVRIDTTTGDSVDVMTIKVKNPSDIETVLNEVLNLINPDTEVRLQRQDEGEIKTIEEW
jgi:hypothetical protein